MIARIGYVDAILRIHADAVGPSKFARAVPRMADGTQESAAELESLNPFHDFIFANEDFVVRIDSHRARQNELARIRSAASPLREELSVWREFVHALVMRLYHEDVALGIVAHAFGFAEVRLRHLP